MSFLDELRQVHDRVLASAEKVLPVPERGVLPSKWRYAVRYRPPSDRDKLLPVVAAYRDGGALRGDEMLQFLIDCHDEILKRSDGEWVPADPDGGPLRFDGSDTRWGLGENGTARQCVAKLYHLDSQPLAADGTVDTLVDWLQGMDVEALMRAEGESVGGGT